MELLVGLLVVSSAVLGAAALRGRATRGGLASAELGVVRQLLHEDAALLGEQLARLERDVSGYAVDDEWRHDIETAREAYDTARAALQGSPAAAEVGRVVEALTSGRYAVACALARAERRPAPKGTTPCFFNPQHGPATTQVVWTRPGRGTRTVPTCAEDAERRAAGEEPDARVVVVRGRRVPYWEVGELAELYTNTASTEDTQRGRSASAISASVRDGKRDVKAYARTFHSYPGKRFDGDFQRRDPS